MEEADGSMADPMGGLVDGSIVVRRNGADHHRRPAGDFELDGAGLVQASPRTVHVHDPHDYTAEAVRPVRQDRLEPPGNVLPQGFPRIEAEEFQKDSHVALLRLSAHSWDGSNKELVLLIVLIKTICFLDIFTFMEWLNYHHLLYFWTAAREGSVTAAARTLNLSQPALSTQIRALEESLGERLFEKAGRGLRLTEAGQMAFRYADEIFALGREFQHAVKGRPTGRGIRLVVGVSDVLPKLMVHRLLRPALEIPEPVRFVCREGTLGRLLQALQAHEVDIVLSDVPCTPQAGPRAFNHLLGECGVDIFASPALRARCPGLLPQALDGAPMLLPSEGHALRRSLEAWLERRGLKPVVAGEFDDSALLETFGAEGLGFFAAPSAIAEEVVRAYGVLRLGALEDLKARIYAVSADRRLAHPAVQAILKVAKEEVFS